MYLTTLQFIAWNKVSTAIFIVKSLRWPGIEPGSTAWKAAMLTTIPPTLVDRMAFQVVPDKTIIEL